MSDSVLVIGGGVAGTRAALELAQAGAHVVLVEKKPILGGAMAARLGDADEIHALASGVDVPDPREVMQYENIEVFTLSEVAELAGEVGRFKVSIRQRARFVTDACTRCNHCPQVCPVVKANEYESGLTFRKAIYLPLRDAAPEPFFIKIEDCLNDPPNYLACQRCVEVCDDHAIDFNMPHEQVHQRKVGSVVLAVGYDLAGDMPLDRFSYGDHPDILTSAEFESMLSPTGPTGGDVERLSNEEYPEKVLIALWDGTRLSWNYSALHTAQLAAQEIKDITVLYKHKKAFGVDFDSFWEHTGWKGVKLVQGEVEQVRVDDGRLRVSFMEHGQEERRTDTFDMLLITTPVKPVGSLPALAKLLDIKLGKDGYPEKSKGEAGLAGTSRPGIYIAGCAGGPKNVPDSVAEGKGAAVHALRHLDKRVSVAKKAGANGDTGLLVSGKLLSEAETLARFEQIVWSITSLGEGGRR